MHGNTVVTAVTLAIGENESKIAYFSNSALQRTVRPQSTFLSNMKRSDMDT